MTSVSRNSVQLVFDTVCTTHFCRNAALCDIATRNLCFLPELINADASHMRAIQFYTFYVVVYP